MKLKKMLLIKNLIITFLLDLVIVLTNFFYLATPVQMAVIMVLTSFCAIWGLYMLDNLLWERLKNGSRKDV